MSEVVVVGLLMLCVPVMLIAFALFMSIRHPIDISDLSTPPVWTYEHSTTRPQAAEGDGDG